MRNISARWLGRVPYGEALALQEKLLHDRTLKRIGDTLLLLEHDSVITLGRGADATNVIVTQDDRERLGIELFETARGGDVTFHGPGQLVAYPIFDLTPDRRDVRKYVQDLAEIMIACCKDYAISAGTIPGDATYVGVWVDRDAPEAWTETSAS